MDPTTEPGQPGQPGQPGEPGESGEPGGPEGPELDPPTQPPAGEDDDEPLRPPPLDDPNVLVAIASARIRLTEIKTIRAEPYITMINTKNPELSRFVHLLDALATLAVNKDGLTIAIAMHKTTGIMQFTVAENNGVSKLVIGHLEWLLRRLKDYRVAKGDKRDQIRFEIMKETYLHSRPKIWSRLNRRKWLFDLEEHLLPGGTLVWPQKYIDLISSFIRMHETLNCIAEWSTLTYQQTKFNETDGRTKADPVTEDQWKDLFLAMDGCIEGLSSVQQNTLFTRVECSAYAAAALKGSSAAALLD